ncbi:hypothetical protein HK102_000211, partial [Quaeritorhiza haematococci]
MGLGLHAHQNHTEILRKDKDYQGDDDESELVTGSDADELTNTTSDKASTQSSCSASGCSLGHFGKPTHTVVEKNTLDAGSCEPLSERTSTNPCSTGTFEDSSSCDHAGKDIFSLACQTLLPSSELESEFEDQSGDA